MANPNDATIDIPLTTVTSKTGASKGDMGTYGGGPYSEKNEKAGLFRRAAAGRRRKAKEQNRGHSGEEEEDALTEMGRLYNKILNFSVVTRYFLYVLPLALIIAVPIIIGATAAHHRRIGKVRVLWLFTWIEIVWLSLWVSKLAAKLLPRVFQFLCGVVSSGTRKYALVLKNLEIPLSLSGWALASLATFFPLMTKAPDPQRFEDAKNSQTTPKTNATALAGNSTILDFGRSTDITVVQPWELIVQKILAAFFIASLIFLGEKLIIQLISIGYHRTQFDEKIKVSKRKINLLTSLYDASRQLFPAYCDEFAEQDYIINDSIAISSSKQEHRHSRSGSATPMRLLQNVGRVGDKITSVFGNIAQEVTGKQVFNPNSAHSVVVEALEKTKSSEALAQRIWMSFVAEGNDALFEEDIVEVLGNARQAEAEECFAGLDRDGNGDISLDEMVLTVCEFGRERHSIANSLHDVDQAISALDGLLCAVVFVVVIFVFVAFLNSSFTTTLATAGTALLSLSFVFAVTAQEILGSCIFLFVKHPFDVLDRVDIGDDKLVVQHISLLYTVFRKVECNKLTQVPNIVLNSLWVQNISRSKQMTERLPIKCHFDTTLEDIQLLKQQIQNFVRDKDNSRDFLPDVDVEVTGVNDMDKMELTVEIKHKSNWANETIRAARRSKFMCALVLALRKVPIYAPGGGGATLGSVDQPTYSVSVSDAEAAKAREAFAATKEGKRLAPTKPAAPTKTGTGLGDPSSSPKYRLPHPLGESAALTDLNSRDPAAAFEDPSQERPQRSGSGSTSSASSTGNDAQRNAELDEVRGLLRRQSTQGKRRPAAPLPDPSIPAIIETYHSSGSEYQSYPPQTLDPYLQRTQRYQPGGYPPQPPQMQQQQQQVPQGLGMSGMQLGQGAVAPQRGSPPGSNGSLPPPQGLPPPGPPPQGPPPQGPPRGPSPSQLRRPAPGHGNAFADEARQQGR